MTISTPLAILLNDSNSVGLLPDSRFSTMFLPPLKTSGADRRKWKDAVAQIAQNSNKVFPRDFDNAKYKNTILRSLGKRSKFLRSVSGLFLPAPDPNSSEPFKIYEEPPSSFSPKPPHSLLNQPVPERCVANMPYFKGKSTYVLEIPGGSFHGHDYSLFDNEMYPIDWEPPFWAVDCGLPGTLFRKRLHGPKYLGGSAFLLGAPAAGGNIWHFLFDSLPKLRVLKSSGGSLDDFDHILIDSYRMPYVTEALDMLGVNQEKILETEKMPFLRFDTLTHVTLGCVLPPYKWVLEWLREAFLPQCKTPSRNRKVFISRSGAHRRRLLGEEEIFKSLEKLGFERVFLERLSLREQIEVMASAAQIVSSHGAGLTHIVWAPPQTRVVELYAPEYVNTCYWGVAEMMDQQYAFAVGDPAEPSDAKHSPATPPLPVSADIFFRDTNILTDSIIKFLA